MGTTERYDLATLATLADTAPRTVRFYIGRGLVPPPHGARRTAWYGREHLDRLVAIRRWQASGITLERIAELLADPADPPVPARRAGTIEVRSHLIVDEGIELVVEPGRAGLAPHEMRALFAAVTDAWHRIRERPTKERKP